MIKKLTLFIMICIIVTGCVFPACAEEELAPLSFENAKELAVWLETFPVDRYSDEWDDYEYSDMMLQIWWREREVPDIVETGGIKRLKDTPVLVYPADENRDVTVSSMCVYKGKEFQVDVNYIYVSKGSYGLLGIGDYIEQRFDWNFENHIVDGKTVSFRELPNGKGVSAYYFDRTDTFQYVTVTAESAGDIPEFIERLEIKYITRESVEKSLETKRIAHITGLCVVAVATVAVVLVIVVRTIKKRKKCCKVEVCNMIA